MPQTVVTARGGANIERHAMSLPLVVVRADRHCPQVHRTLPDVLSHHLRITLETATAQHHRTGMELQRAIVARYRIDSDDSAIGVLNETARCSLIKYFSAILLKVRGESLDQGQASPGWLYAGLYRCRECIWQGNKANPKRL